VARTGAGADAMAVDWLAVALALAAAPARAARGPFARAAAGAFARDGALRLTRAVARAVACPCLPLAVGLHALGVDRRVADARALGHQAGVDETRRARADELDGGFGPESLARLPHDLDGGGAGITTAAPVTAVAEVVGDLGAGDAELRVELVEER